jgi:hypothetical protein
MAADPLVNHPIQMQLWLRNGNGWDIVSRGATVNIFGDICTYIGNAPDLTTYFWVAPGDYRYLVLEQLEQAGYTLARTYPKES